MKVGDIVELVDKSASTPWIERLPRYSKIVGISIGGTAVDIVDLNTGEPHIHWLKWRFRPADPLIVALYEAQTK